MDYYKIMRNHQPNTEMTDDVSSLKGLIGDVMDKGYIAYDVVVDGKENKKMLIYEHTDPIDSNVHDMRAICTDKNGLHWGNIISLPDGRSYLSVTTGDWNGAYLKYKIRELTDDVRFNKDSITSTKAIIASKGFYDESSFVNETTVFEDKELRAALVAYDDTTKNLVLFDDIFINSTHYKIVKIDDYTLKEYDEEYGVLQLVIIDTPFGEIIKNEEQSIRGILMSARVKDKILNSVSRELVCEHNNVRRGDYIKFKYDRDKKGTMEQEIYLIINKPTMGKNYDISLGYLCENKTRLLDSNGNIVDVPLYFEDNRMRIDKTTDNNFIKLKNSSYMAMAQFNDVTKHMKNKVNRIMVGDEVYSITGTDDTSKGIIIVGLEQDRINYNDDNIELGIANYKSQMEEINKKENSPMGLCIVGSSDICKGYPEEYSIESESQDITWSVNCDYIKITQNGNKCTLQFDELKHVNKTFELSAICDGNILKKEIITISL